MKYANQPPTHTEDNNRAGHGGRRRGHGWVMMLCCIPMVVIAVALAAAGIASITFLSTAVLCMGMMALMMRGMNHSGRGK